MIHYLVLIKGGWGTQLNTLSSVTKKNYLSLWNQWLRILKKDNYLVTGAPLVPDGMALDFNGNEEDVPDNYDLASEMVTGFCVIKTKDEAEAINILKGCPFLGDEFTSCELRRFKSMG